MSTDLSLSLRKSLLTKAQLPLVLAVSLLVLVGMARTEVRTTIQPAKPNKAGTVKLTIYDDTTGKNTGELAIDIPADSTCAEKASLMWKAIKAKIEGDPELNAIFTVGPAPAPLSFIITDTKGAMRINWIPPDTTDEKSGLKVNGNPVFPPPSKNHSGEPQSHRSSWAFSFMLWPALIDSGTVVPAGKIMTLVVKKPNGSLLPISVMGNGVLTVAEVQQMAMDQFQALGVSFTPITDPVTGMAGFMSQSFTGTKQQGAGWARWDAAWSTYQGGVGVDGAPIP
jgi:hypothetical protein